jgi:putative zinc finger/helix-turn-helix YgiT family protein
VCRQYSLRRVKQEYVEEVSHEGRSPVTVRVPDLEVIACTNPNCKPEHAGDTVILDDAAIRRVDEETYRAFGLLTPAEIRAGRKKLGVKQQELQELLGLGGNSLSRWEKGRVYQSRAMDTLLRLAFDLPEVVAVLRRSRSEGHNGTSAKRGVADAAHH